ncbi:MAG TPA: alpha-glucan family phosphorylase [Acidimicrobiales bacterium]|nr:alpha-glucan family phosphorylase [Acidimicrobiales bacterium]
MSDVHDEGGRATPPVSYADLITLAENLRWTWHMDVRALFESLFPEVRAEELEWPLRLLRELGVAEIESRLASMPALAALARAVVDDRSDYLEEAPATWFPTTHGDAPSLEVAFLAAEFAVTDSLPIFAGGLGAIAGEQLKSASALGVPLVGLGLLYRESSHQRLDAVGSQRESWEVLDPTSLPVSLVRGADTEPVTVDVPFPGRDVVAQVWSAPVGRTWLYLLDTDVPQNAAEDRGITARLYGGSLETRIQQELVLGIGGMRALWKCGHRPSVLHLNEGHTAFAALQLIAQIERRSDVPFDVARRIAAAQMIFTTHTPVSAGHDYFPVALAAPYLAPYARLLGLSDEALFALGRYRPEDPTDTFCPTVLALRLCDARNGVSRLHGAVTRQQWGGLWRRLPTDEVPISHVTNGVHLQSWITPEIDRLLDRQLGEEWRKVPGEPESWAAMLDADDAELWHARNAARARLVAATRERRLSLIGRRRSDAVAIDEAKQLLDRDAFTIGFVGRFVAYKRPTLFLRDPDRLARLLSDPDRPVQIVFAGKAHPNDEHGKRLLQTVNDFAQQRGFTRRLVFIEDFDLTADRAMSQGVDLWLNTPRRPLEACGIGGMKAGVNGALNLSTLDGWWDEAWNDAMPGAPPIGWCIGTADAFEDHDLQDALDAESLYDQLEHDIVPRFFDRDAQGIPRRWIASVRQSMATLAETWRSHRMVEQYVDDLYLPAAVRAARLQTNGAARARRLAATLGRVSTGWPQVRLEVATCTVADGVTTVDVHAHLGELSTRDVTVDLWVMPPDAPAYPFAAHFLVGPVGPGATVAYRAVARVEPDARLSARVLPVIEDAPSRFLPGLIAWAD